MFIPRAIVGAALLGFGRKAFWLFVAGVGFVAGLYLATQAFQFRTDWAVLSTAIAGGLLGALLAMVFQSVGLGLAGFVGGGYAAWTGSGSNGGSRIVPAIHIPNGGFRDAGWH